MMSVITLSPLFNTRSSLKSSTMTRMNKLSSSIDTTAGYTFAIPYSSLLSSSLSSAKNSTLRSSDSNILYITPSKPSVDLITSNNYKSKEFMELLYRVREGLKYNDPELCEEGVNGTYFLKDKNGNKIGVFKPQDEEGTSENNPKKHGSEGDLPTKGLLPGEGSLREVAAHLLDHEGLYGVPKTQLVKITHSFPRNNNNSSNNNNSNLITKIGSLQEYIENDGSCEDYGPSTFPINEVHKIGILDIQICNLDRHAGNILIKKTRVSSSNSSYGSSSSYSSYSTITNLIPIDQGFSMGDTMEGITWFEWMNWPQSKAKFETSMKNYIERINVEKDLEILKELGIRKECLKNMKLSVGLLKKAVEYDLSLYDIGLMICRKQYSLTSSMPSSRSASTSNMSSSNSSPSLLELMVQKTKALIEKRAKHDTLSNLSSPSSSSSSYDDSHINNRDQIFIDLFQVIVDQELKNRFSSSSSPECTIYTPSTSRRN